jgi:hypothetical protein
MGPRQAQISYSALRSTRAASWDAQPCLPASSLGSQGCRATMTENSGFRPLSRTSCHFWWRPSLMFASCCLLRITNKRSQAELGQIAQGGAPGRPESLRGEGRGGSPAPAISPKALITYSQPPYLCTSTVSYWDTVFSSFLSSLAKIYL